MDPILKALQFAKAHAVATAVAVTATVGGGYVAYQNYNGAERTVDGGAYVKQDVAVNDRNGDLRMKMQGLGKEAPKANEPAKADAKADGDDASKKLQDALKAAKEGDMKAETEEAAKASQPTFEEAPKPEEPYIPEQATADETLDNVLDGNDSGVFKPANFASSGSGETTGSQSKGGKAAAKATGKSGAKAASGKKASVAKTAKGDAKSGTAASGEATASGATETAKTGGDTGASDEKGSDGSEDKAGVETPGKTEEVSDNKKGTPTAEPMTKAPETGVPANVEDTVSTEKREKVFENSDRNDARRMRGFQGSFDYEAAARKKREEEKREEEKREEEKRQRRKECLADLKNAFEKECDCDADDVAPTSNRTVGGITTTDMMRFAANPNFKVKTVTLYADDDMNSSDLIALLKELGAKREDKRNPNIGFYLKDGAKLLESAGKIPGVDFYPDKSGNVMIAFEKSPGTASSAKKDASAKTTAKPASGVPAGGSTPTTTGSATGGTSDDWLGVLWNNAEEEARLKARTYNGFFEPDTDGVLCDDDLNHDLENGYYNGDELIEGILQYNANETKKTEAEQKLITLVPLVYPDGSDVFCRLSAEQMKRAKGVVFITDEDGAKEAEADGRHFVTEDGSFIKDSRRLKMVCVLQDDGTMSEAQKKVAEVAKKAQLEGAKRNEAAKKIGSAWKAYKSEKESEKERLKNNPDLSQSEESAKVIATFGLEHFLTKAVGSNQGVIAIPYEGCCEGKEKEWISALRKLCLFPPEETRDKVLITVVGDAKNREACETFVKKIVDGCAFDSTEKRMIEADARSGMGFWIVENKFEIPAEKAKDFTFDTPVELLLKSAGELGWDSNGLELPALAGNFFAGFDQKFSSKPSELFGSISDEEDGNKITCLPYALKEGAGDAEIQFAWMLRGWSTALGRHVVVKNTDDTCDLYAPYDGFMLQKQTINDMKKYFSRSMFDGVIVTERDNNKKWKALSTPERKTFVERFMDEIAMDLPFAENKAASGGLLLGAVPELGEDGFETGKERALTTDDKVIKNNNLATAALMFNPRAFAKRMAVAPRTYRGTFVLELMLKHGFEEPFMKALQEFENGSGLNNGSFWIKVSERDSVLDAAQRTYNPEGNTFVTVYKNFKSSHWLRFANARELEMKKKFRINNGSVLTKAMETLRKEVERERKTKAEEEKKQAVRDTFNAGGEQTVTPEILEAFGTESVLDIIRTASQKDSKVTQLSVSFKDSDEFEEALDIIADALRNDGNKVLKLNVKEISKFEPSPEEKAELKKKEEEENKRRLDTYQNLDGYRFDPLPFWLALRYDKKIRNGMQLLVTSYIDGNEIGFSVLENNEEEIPYQEDNRNTRQNNNEEEEHRSDGNERNNREDEPNNENRNDGENNNEENNRQENEKEIPDAETIAQRITDCLKVIETVISGLDPVDFKEVPADIEAEPETKDGENMLTCFKRLLSGYCRCNGFKNGVKMDNGARDVLWTDKDFSARVNLETVKNLLKDNGKAFKEILLGKLNPLLKGENEAQVMTKAFASRVWRCIVYYVQEGKFPEVSLLDRRSIFDEIRRFSLTNFLGNDGNGDCGVISVLQGNALIDGSDEDKAPNRKWTADEIKKLRKKAGDQLPLADVRQCTGKNGEVFWFFAEDAAKWDKHTQRINSTEAKSLAVTGKEYGLAKVSRNIRDELARNFTAEACKKRITAEGANTVYEKSLLPDDFRWFAKACGKTILLVQEGVEDALVSLYFRDGTQLSNGTAFFENLFTKEEAKRIVCIYMERRSVNSDDGKNVSHYKAFSAEGRKALFDTLGYRENDGTEELKTAFSKAKLDLTGGSDESKKIKDIEKRMRARVLFECDPSGFTKACFASIKPESVTFPSYPIYGNQQTDALKELSGTNDGLQMTLKWSEPLGDNELNALNQTFGTDHLYLKRTDGEFFRFETVRERIDRWREQKLYTPTMTEDGVLDWSKETRLAEDLKKSEHRYAYFHGLLERYVTKKNGAWMYGDKVVKVIDVRGLEKDVFDEWYEHCSFSNYIAKDYPGIAFRVLPSYKSKESRSMKVTAGGSDTDKWSDCVVRTEEEKTAWDNEHLPKLARKRLHNCVDDYNGKATFEQKDWNVLKDRSSEDFVLLLSENKGVKEVDFSKEPLDAKAFNSIFQTAEDIKHLGLLSGAKLWIPISREGDFGDEKMFLGGKSKKIDGVEFISFSVLPKSIGIRFIEEAIVTEKKQNDRKVIRLVWNSYARHLLNCARNLANAGNAIGCEIFADKVAKVAEEQARARVCIDLSDVDYNKAFGDTLVPALSERGIDVLVRKSASKECLENFGVQGRKGIAPVYCKDGADIWFLPGADLTIQGNKNAVDTKAQTLLDKKNEILRAIETDNNPNMALSEEMLGLATVKEIFDALEKNATKGTVTVPWYKNDPKEVDVIAWARAYCGSKPEDGRKLMERSVKLIPGREGAVDFFPETLERDVMKYCYGSFGCLCKPQDGTITFVQRDRFNNEKRDLMLNVMEGSKYNYVKIDEWDWNQAQLFFMDLVAAKMAPSHGDGFFFKTTPNMVILLDALAGYASKAGGDRMSNLEIEFQNDVKIKEEEVKSWLAAQTNPEVKARISYKAKNKIVSSVTLRSRFNYLSDTVRSSGKLSFVLRDITDEEGSGTLANVLMQAAKNGLKELVVPEEVLLETNNLRKIFLEAARKMLSDVKKNQTVTVTSGKEAVIDLLLKNLGNDGNRGAFCIESEDGSKKKCLIVSRKTFLEKCRKANLDKIKNNTSDNIEVSTSDTDEKTLKELCEQLNKPNAGGKLTASGFNKDVANKMIEEILKSGVMRHWTLTFKKCTGAVMDADLLKCMKNGWAFDKNESPNQLTVEFYPPASKNALSAEISEFLKDRFKATTDSYDVPKKYWYLDMLSVLKAADDRASTVSELIFDVKKAEKEELNALASGIETFCKEVSVQRTNDWKLKLTNLNYEKRSKFKDTLEKINEYDTDRKRMVHVENTHNDLVVTTVSIEDEFLRDLQGSGATKGKVTGCGFGWRQVPVKFALQCANLEKCTVRGMNDMPQKPTTDELKEAVASVLKSTTGRTGWFATFAEPVIDKADAPALLGLNGEADVHRYVIPCGNRTLLFVNKAMYDFWTQHLQKDANIRIEKTLTEQTDEFLPILFAASTPSSVTKTLTVASDVDVCKGHEDDHPFEYVIDYGGGRHDWDIVFEDNRKHVPFEHRCKCTAEGIACGLKLFDPSKNENTLTFLPCGKAGEMRFENSDIKRKIDDEHESEVDFPQGYGENDWFTQSSRVPLGIVLEYIEKETDVSTKKLTINIRYKKILVDDLKAFLPKAGKSNRPWQLKITCSDTKEAKTFADAVNNLNQKTLRYGFVANPSGREVSVTARKLALSERVESDGTLTLFEEEVKEEIKEVKEGVVTTSLPKFFKKLNLLNAATGTGAPAVKMTNAILPFGSEFFVDQTPGVSFSFLKEALVKLLKSGKDENWKTLTLSLKGAFDAKAFEKAVNDALEAANVKQSVTVSPEGVITFVPRVPMPSFESVSAQITTKYTKNGNGSYGKLLSNVNALKWTDEWTQWFERPETDFGKFIEALAEHPTITHVDFSHMPKDSVGHRKYSTEDAVRQLLKVNDVWFTCRFYGDDDADASKTIWKTWINTYKLSAVIKEGTKYALWRYFDKTAPECCKMEENDGRWFRIHPTASYVVSKKENGKKRLLWNRAALLNLLSTGTSVPPLEDRLEGLTGRQNAAKLPYDNLKNKGADGQPLVPYEAIDTIDFTIGDPEVTVVTVGNNSHKWADVHKIVGEKDFWNKIGAATGAQRDHIRCVSMIAYADCLTDEAKKAINKANWIIKARGQKGGRNVVEIKYDIGSVFANIGSAFNNDTVRLFDAGDACARHESEEIFAAGGKWVPKADTNDGTALRVFGEAKRQYDKMPFDAFLKIVKQKAGNISKIDLTKFDDKGAKASFNEFLKHPMWIFTLPSARLAEIKGGEKAGFVKILGEPNTAVTFIVFPQLKLEKPGEYCRPPKNGRAERYITNAGKVSQFAGQYFTEFTKQLGVKISSKKPDIVVLDEIDTVTEKLADTDMKAFKAFFDTENFRGIGFEFPKKIKEQDINFEYAVREYNKDKNSKNELAWSPGTGSDFPVVYVLPGRWTDEVYCPKDVNASKTWLEGKNRQETISRLEKLKKGLTKEAGQILKANLAIHLCSAIDRLTSDDWQVVFGFKLKSDDCLDTEVSGAPKLLLKADESLLRGDNADFVLRLCNGFPLSENQRHNFGLFVRWAQNFGDDNLNWSRDKSLVVEAVLRFFLSFPDMSYKDKFLEAMGYSSVKISTDWQKTWNFTFGQLMKKYKDRILWSNTSFKKVQNKDTHADIGPNDYAAITKSWENKDVVFRRNASERDAVEKRFKAFLKSLRGFNDWNTVGGGMKRWEDYQLNRWKKYLDLRIKDSDLPASLPNKAAIDAAESGTTGTH